MSAVHLADHADRDLITHALDETLIVEAAAGTGKTTELVRRIVRVIETGRAEVTGIVCVTFTEKAAGELKLRLREALEAARGAARPESDERDRLDRAVRQLEEAQISTIHGFCADLLRERPVEAGVDPLFSVLTESQARRLYDVAFHGWFQEQLANPPDCVQRSLRRPTFSGFGPAADNDEGPVDRLRNAGWELIQWRDFAGDWERPVFDRDARIDGLVHALRLFADLSAAPDSRHDGLSADTRPARQLDEEIRRTEAVGPRDHNRLEAALIELGRNRQFQRARKGSGKTYGAGVPRERVVRAREELETALSAFEADANADLAALLRRELRGCEQRYAAAKAKAGALDFLDLLLEARKLVRDNDQVRRSFQRRFARIFVDEFQDTDPLQAEILLLLAGADPAVRDWTAIRPVPGKLFMVGDPKQSIYRFRRADVGIYRRVYEMLAASGARRLTLRTSFRSRPNIQRAINAAFEAPMTADDPAGYVALEPSRPDLPGQPTVVVLPVPAPYGVQRVANTAVEQSLPDAAGAFVEWLVKESGWKVAERPGASPTAALAFTPGQREQLVPIQARHVCLLFRRFVSWEQDVTRPYVRALEARGIPHLLVGGRSFHNRGEIETLRAALAAIEWPDDELSVFATLRGALFAIGDEELMQYRTVASGFHPFRIPPEAGQDGSPLQPIAAALGLLRSLHRSRNYVPVATTVSRLLDATRAHVRFALEHGGEQVLANVLHVAELARRYDAEGGISFRGFIDELREQAEDGQAGEAPILEEGSDGVRIMTVHKAKGLEFPVVVLADITAKQRPGSASRYLDAERHVCAVRLAGCSPLQLVQHEAEELLREQAEGVRLAYVAATRARDLLVVPAVGDEEREGWIEPLNRAVYPPVESRRGQTRGDGCPAFRSKDSVLSRPNGDPALPTTVCPGAHSWGTPPREIVWWDPSALHLGAEAPLGIRRSELIVKDVPREVVDEGLSAYRQWRAARDGAVAQASQPSLLFGTATEWARKRAAAGEAGPPVRIIELPREHGRPSGPRFGTLVHAVLATVPLDGGASRIRGAAASSGRALAASDEEIEAAARAVETVLAHEVLQLARDADAHDRCRREVPVSWCEPGGALVEGVVDLAFGQAGRWTIVDFKTDEEIGSAAQYLAQVGLYATAVRHATGQPVAAILMRV